MQRFLWNRLLAVVMAAPIASHAQTPQPRIRQIASLPGVDVDEWVRLPNGRVLLYTVGDSIIAYDLPTKRGTLVTRGYLELIRVSHAGDRIAYCRQAKDDKGKFMGEFIWSMPIDSNTGIAAGPARQLSATEGDYASFSPDGKLIAFRTPPYGRRVQSLRVVPVAGGDERTLAAYTKGMRRTAWSADGKSVLVEVVGDTLLTIERIPAGGGAREPTLAYPDTDKVHRAGPLDGRTALYRPEGDVSRSEGRMAYITAAGARGEFKIPRGSVLGDDTGSPLLASHTTNSAGQRTTTIYELDLSPIFQAIGKR